MKTNLKVLFFGNHTVGVTVLQTLTVNPMVDIVGIIAHPPDPEDGIAYQSVYRFAEKQNLPLFRGSNKKLMASNFLDSKNFDLIIVADYKYLIASDIFSCARVGAVNFHPSLLPKYRGRAPMNWSIIKGEKELGLTLHFLTDEVDAGNVIFQQGFHLDISETIKDALQKIYPLYQSFTERLIFLLTNNLSLPSQKQDHSLATVYPARVPEDGKIDWGDKSTNIVNLVRAVSFPYPGAFSFVNGKKIFIWAAKLCEEVRFRHFDGKKPGQIIEKDGHQLLVKTGDGALLILEQSDTKKVPFKLKVGECFE